MTKRYGRGARPRRHPISHLIMCDLGICEDIATHLVIVRDDNMVMIDRMCLTHAMQRQDLLIRYHGQSHVTIKEVARVNSEGGTARC